MSPTVSWGKLKRVFMKKNCRQPVENFIVAHIRLQLCSAAPSWLSGFLFPCRVKCKYTRVYLGLLPDGRIEGQTNGHSLPQMQSVIWLGSVWPEYWHYVGKHVCFAVSIICSGFQALIGASYKQCSRNSCWQPDKSFVSISMQCWHKVLIMLKQKRKHFLWQVVKCV